MIFGLMFVFAFSGFVSSASASTCDLLNPCANGPIVAQQPGGRFLSAGQEDCPAWFPQNFGHACYTMRAVGAYFVPLQ